MGFLAQLIAGPVLGLLGSALGSVFKWFEKKQEIEAQRLRQDHEIALTKLNIEARGKEMENEAWLAHISATAEMVKSSYEHDASYGPVSKGAAVWLRWVRPALTLILLALVAAEFFYAGEQYRIEGMTIQERIVASSLMMCEAALTWWFADRTREARKERA